MKRIMRIFIMSLLLSVTMTAGWCSTTSDSSSDEERGFVPKKRPPTRAKLSADPPYEVMTTKDGKVAIPYYIEKLEDKQKPKSVDPKEEE